MNISCNWNDVLPTNPPDIEHDSFTNEEIANILTATLAMPFQDIHACYDISTERTKHEIETCFRELLTKPLKMKLDSIKPKVKMAFTLEEDFWLLTYITKYHDLEIDTLLKNFKDRFYPIRTQKEILERIDEIKKNSPEENDQIITNFARQILTDKLVAESYQNLPNATVCDQQKCMKLIEDKPKFIKNDEINQITSLFPMFVDYKFTNGELALLVSESYVFSMVRSRVSIGYSRNFNEVDIDLRLAATADCCHISKKQAVLSFLQNGHFYIENIGSSIFRVNGVIIPPKKVACLPEMALLDFCDQLYIFIPNTQLVNKIMKSYNIAKTIKKNRTKLKEDEESKPSKPEVVEVTLPNGVKLTPESEML